jgi:hypothetical protein
MIGRIYLHCKDHVEDDRIRHFPDVGRVGNCLQKSKDVMVR